MPRKPAANDATALIRNEGRMSGYLDALDDLIAATQPQPEQPEKKKIQPYGSSQFPTENQNKPA